MAGQERQQQSPDEAAKALEAANKAFQDAQGERKSAKDDLQKAENSLNKSQQKLENLQADERELQKQQTENAARVENLPHEIQDTKRTLENLQADARQLQRQDAQNSGTLARLISRLTRKPARLTRKIQALQQTVENLQEEQRQLPARQTENAAELERLKPEIEGAERTKEDKGGKVRNLRSALGAAESKVFEQASKVREKASEEIIDRAWKLEVVPDSLKTLVGGASAVYAPIPFTNLSYDYAFYCFFGIKLFKHSQIQDFATPALESLIIVNFVVWISLIYAALKVLASPKISIIVEVIAGRLHSFSNSLKETRGKMMFLLPLFILSFIVVPGAVAWWQAKSISTPHNDVRTFYKLKPVNVVTVRGLKPVNDLIHIGSSSTHAFFLKRESGNTSHRIVIPISLESAHAFFLKKNPTKVEAMAIPLSGIVCMDDENNYCEPDELPAQQEVTHQTILDELANINLKEQDNPWIGELIQALKETVTENGLRQHIAGKMNCSKGRLKMSEFIRFGRDEATFSLEKKDRDQNEAKLEAEKKERERNKVSAFVNDVNKQGGKPDKWTVFGFASADGEKGGNDDLSQKRAVAVESLLCEALKCDRTNGTKIAVEGLSEDHSINGVANSRSARIAVCVKGAAS